MLKFALRSPDGQAGLFFVGFGTVVAWLARGYHLGTPARMGPGFFPFALGVLLVLLGLGVLVSGWRNRVAEEQGAFQWRPLVFVTLAVAAGGVLLTRFGLVPAVIGATFIGALSERRPRWLRVLAVSIVLVGFAWVVFVYALHLRLPLVRF